MRMTGKDDGMRMKRRMNEYETRKKNERKKG